MLRQGIARFIWMGLGMLLLLQTGQAALPRAYAADEYDGLRSKWLISLAGEGNDPLDEDAALQIASITNTAQSNWSSLITASGRTSLWNDLSDWTVSSTITNSYKRIRSMAIAYATEGSALYGDAALGTAIVSSLDWMQANKYNASIAQYNNWWDWQIGAPQALTDIMVLMYAQLSSAQRSAYIQTIDAYVPNPTVRLNSSLHETGANRSDKAQVVIVRGILGKSSAKIAQGRDALSAIFLYVNSGDGFYRDGSFVQHTNIAYTGSYGRVLLAGLSKLLYVLENSTWSLTDPNVSNVYAWVRNSFQPLLYRGAIMDMVRGRAVARKEQQDHEMGRDITLSILRLSLSAPAGEKEYLQRLVRGVTQQDTSFSNYYAGLPLFEMMELKRLEGNPDIVPLAPGSSNHVFNKMARAVHIRPDFAFGVSMFSSRIGRYEAGNGENLRGWHTGEGMTYLYDADLTHYSDRYWLTVDPYRLPGTTVDPLVLTNGQGSGSTSTYNFVGGVSDGLNGVAGMRFTGLASGLTGRKSWFMLGDQIAALGSSITSTSGRPIETIVEGRKLAGGAGSQPLTVGGILQPMQSGWSAALSDTAWAHLETEASGIGVGYYFPGGADLTAGRETRTGAWSDINTGGGTEPISASYVSLAIPHGVNPSNASYSYILLPHRTAGEVAAYAGAPGIVILENSVDAQGVHDASQHLVAVNFWNNLSKTISVNGASYLSSNKQASVLVKESNDELSLTLSDPTQANTGSIQLELHQSATDVISADSRITVTQLTPTVKLTVQVSGAQGESLKVKLSK
ncbi:polysaccharide lyase 8 family protein [Paenibacillus sp. GCM10023252]|uniref:polysaccharide lyase 8 family protein n=1 Tax=Paenibacillus sp. GCM10023252 TaxID=3252649 RepID=UPI00361D1B28